jgi:hypothetical protein
VRNRVFVEHQDRAPDHTHWRIFELFNDGMYKSKCISPLMGAKRRRERRQIDDTGVLQALRSYDCGRVLEDVDKTRREMKEK